MRDDIAAQQPVGLPLTQRPKSPRDGTGKAPDRHGCPETRVA